MDSTRFGDNGVAIERIDVSAYTVPTDFPELDSATSPSTSGAKITIPAGRYVR
jgi:hypothetical protein